MRIKESIVRNVNILPSFTLVGYSEIAIPVFQRKIHALALTQKTIPVVEEFVLNYVNEGLSLDDIKLILGLDQQQLIDEAWTGLIQRDFVDYISHRVTDDGINYIRTNKVESLEKVEFGVSIDGITGYISKTNNQLMADKTVRSKSIDSIRSNINKPKIENINFIEMKRVFNTYKESDSEVYNGNILDIVHIEGNTTKYKRIDVLVFKNINEEIRIIACDGLNILKPYEENLFELDKKGINLINLNFEDYFADENVNKIDKLIRNSTIDCKDLDYETSNLLWDDYMNEINDEIIIVAPMISQCNIVEADIDRIEKNLKRDAKIKIYLSGKDYINESQKRNYNRLGKLAAGCKNLDFMQTPNYLNKMIINLTRRKAIISIFEKNEINLSSTRIGIVEKFYEIQNELFEDILLILLNAYNIEKIMQFDLTNCNRNNLKRKIENIASLVKDANGYMLDSEDIGWVGENDIPDITNMLNIPLAVNNETFRTFADSLNKSLVESLDSNAKSKRKIKYFWNEFKDLYPELQHILEKIRTYRNRSNHLSLKPDTKKKYFEFLNQDLDGYMPDFIKNGYMVLQWKLLNELERAVKNTVCDIKSKN